MYTYVYIYIYIYIYISSTNRTNVIKHIEIVA